MRTYTIFSESDSIGQEIIRRRSQNIGASKSGGMKGDYNKPPRRKQRGIRDFAFGDQGTSSLNPDRQGAGAVYEIVFRIAKNNFGTFKSRPRGEVLNPIGIKKWHDAAPEFQLRSRIKLTILESIGDFSRRVDEVSPQIRTVWLIR